MFHRLAQDQIEKFAAEGITLAPADVVRLNDAALALDEARGHRGGLLGAPRCRWCGSVLFREPTVQSELWMAEVADGLAANDESWGWMLAFSLAHADEPLFFDREDLHGECGVRRACREFQRTLTATRGEVWAAVNWCRFGREVPAANKLDEEQIAELEANRRAWLYADLAEAVALTGCGVDDLRRLTHPLLERAIRAAWERDGRTFKDSEVGAKTRAWYALVAEIVKRGAPREGEPDQERNS